MFDVIQKKKEHDQNLKTMPSTAKNRFYRTAMSYKQGSTKRSQSPGIQLSQIKKRSYSRINF